MKRRLYLIALGLFVIVLLYDVVVWGAVPTLPEVGPSIAESARREAPLASTYIAIGRSVDAAVPALRAFGEARLTDALSEGFPRMRDDASVSMDLIFNTTWNAQHRFIRTMYWAAPLLLLLTLLLWTRRPKQVRLMRGR